MELYKAGADFVILPQITGGLKASELIKKINKDKSAMKGLKKEHLKYLNSIHRILY